MEVPKEFFDLCKRGDLKILDTPNVDSSLASAAFETVIFDWTYSQHSMLPKNWKLILDFLSDHSADMFSGLAHARYNAQDDNALLIYFLQKLPSPKGISIAISSALNWNNQDKALYILDRVYIVPESKDYQDWFLQTCCAYDRHDYDDGKFDWRFAKRMFDAGVVTEEMLRQTFFKVVKEENSECCFHFWQKQCSVKIPLEWWNHALIEFDYLSYQSIACALVNGADVQNWINRHDDFYHEMRYPQNGDLLYLLDHGVNIEIFIEHVAGGKKLARHITHRKQFAKNKLKWLLPQVLINLVQTYMVV